MRQAPICALLLQVMCYNPVMAFFPIFTDLKNKRALVVGGGKIGEEKALLLLDFGASVSVVSKTFSKKLEEAAKSNKNLTLIPRDFCETDINGSPFLAVAATSDESTNQKICALCKDKAILVCNVTDGKSGSFSFPAIAKSGDIICAISSGGKSPIVSRYVKGIVQNALPSYLSAINDRLGKVRERLKEIVPNQKARREILKSVFDLLLKSENGASQTQIEKLIAEQNDFLHS